MENQDKKTEKVFSFDPDVLSTDSRGRVSRDEAASNPYRIYDALGTGTLYFTTKDAKFWVAPGKEIDPKTFESKFLPYLRWKFDEIVEQDRYEEVEVEQEDAKGNKKVVKERRLIGKELINKFPCTTKNILKKRGELLMQSAQAGETPDVKQIQKDTSPVELRSPAEVTNAIKPQGFLVSSDRLLKNLLRG